MQQQYNEYDAIAFAEDSSFIRWVRHKEPASKAFWEKWLTDHPNKKAIIREAKILVRAIEIKEVEPSQARLDGLWNKIDRATENSHIKVNPIVTTTTTTPVRKLRPLRWVGYAAAAAIAALFVFQFYNPATSISTLKGEHMAHLLPDQSTIELNADSKISYKSKSWASERIVELEGEAFFEVAKGASFKVITTNGTVEVLGTEFNVNARNNTLIVDCKEGKVRVTAKSSTSILTQGQGTRLNGAKTRLLDTYPSNIDKKIGWRTGNYYLEGTTLDHAVEELERQYNIQVVGLNEAILKRKGDYTFRGSSLPDALDDLFFQLPVTITSRAKEEVVIRVDE